MDEGMIALNTALGKAIAETTVETVNNKITKIKLNHDREKQITQYDQLINDLLENKNNLERISRSYKEKLERVIISDEDIESLHNTVATIIQLVKSFSGTTNTDETDSQDQESLDVLLKLLNSDTLKTLQLLGYNYKQAIGEPLTKITADFITKKLTSEQK